MTHEAAIQPNSAMFNYGNCPILCRTIAAFIYPNSPSLVSSVHRTDVPNSSPCFKLQSLMRHCVLFHKQVFIKPRRGQFSNNELGRDLGIFVDISLFSSTKILRSCTFNHTQVWFFTEFVSLHFAMNQHTAVLEVVNHLEMSEQFPNPPNQVLLSPLHTAKRFLWCVLNADRLQHKNKETKQNLDGASNFDHLSFHYISCR